MRIWILTVALALCACTTPNAPYVEPPAPDCASLRNDEVGLGARFMGASTIVLESGASRLVIDGFFSRPSFREVAFTRLRSDVDAVKDGLRRAGVRKADGVIVAHAHYDHAMDVRLVARLTCAPVYGSLSTAHLVADPSAPAPTIIGLGQVYEVGAFEVAAFAAPHAPPPRFEGQIEAGFSEPARVYEYREGEGYAFIIEHARRRMLIVPSANFTPGMFVRQEVDVVFLGAGALGSQPREFIERYWHETVTATRAKVVVLIHWDNFMRSLDQPLEPYGWPIDDFDRTQAILGELARRDSVSVVLPRAFERIDLDRSSAFFRVATARTN